MSECQFSKNSPPHGLVRVRSMGYCQFLNCRFLQLGETSQMGREIVLALEMFGGMCLRGNVQREMSYTPSTYASR